MSVIIDFLETNANARMDQQVNREPLHKYTIVSIASLDIMWILAHVDTECGFSFKKMHEWIALHVVHCIETKPKEIKRHKES